MSVTVFCKDGEYVYPNGWTWSLDQGALIVVNDKSQQIAVHNKDQWLRATDAVLIADC